jgi:hypothetical protein
VIRQLLFIFTLISFFLLSSAFATEKKKTVKTPKHPPPTQYYLSDKLFSNKEIITWVSEALTSSVTLTADDYYSTLANDKQFFTNEGYQDFLNLLDEQHILDTIEEKKLDTKAYLDKPPIIKKQAVASHKYHWEIEATLTTLLQGSGQAYSQDIPITLTVERATPNTGIGILISKIQLSGADEK